MRFRSFVSFSILSSILLLLAMPIQAKPVKEFQKAKQKLNKELTAYLGEEILTIDKKESMKNIVGKADIFGRKVDVGSIEVYVHAIDGKTVHFLIEDDTIHTTESTMSHHSMTQSSGTANASTQYYGNSSYSKVYGSGRTTTIGGEPIETELSSNQRVAVIDTEKQPRLIVGDFKIVFIEVDGYLKYRIEEN